jgi:Fe-S cluster biogenesis protein NfuA
MDDRQARERVAEVDALLERVEALPDAGARELALDLVGALLDLYGEGLARIIAAAGEASAGEPLAVALARDELVGHLLLLHGVHPVALADRVRGALDEVRPYLASHGGDVELLGVERGMVSLRLKGACSGCPSSTVTLRSAVEEAIQRAAPDVDGIVAEDDPAAAPAPLQIDLTCPVPLPMVG